LGEVDILYNQQAHDGFVAQFNCYNCERIDCLLIWDPALQRRYSSSPSLGTNRPTHTPTTHPPIRPTRFKTKTNGRRRIPRSQGSAGRRHAGDEVEDARSHQSWDDDRDAGQQDRVCIRWPSKRRWVGCWFCQSRPGRGAGGMVSLLLLLMTEICWDKPLGFKP